MKQRTVYITEDQDKFLKTNSMTLPLFVRNKLEEVMKTTPLQGARHPHGAVRVVTDKEPYLKDWILIPTDLPNEAGQPTYYVIDPKWDQPKKAGAST